jgi:hypothetical protein
MKYYTGVGSRKAPQDILDLITRIAAKLEKLGYTLRSGGAKGCDLAFESGTRTSDIFFAQDANAEAMKLASRFHPAWDRCSDYARNLHGRNCFQVLGPNLDHPSEFLICWTPDGAISDSERSIQTGGTGTAISVADYFHIPVFNLQRADDRARLESFVS